MNQSKRQYEKMKSELKKTIVQICKEKKLQFKFVSNPKNTNNKNILYVLIYKYRCVRYDKKWHTYYDFILIYGENCIKCLMFDEPNMKLMIEQVINFDENTSSCDICYENKKYVTRCATCSFCFFEYCNKKLIECPQCKRSQINSEDINSLFIKQNIDFDMIAMEHMNYLNAMLDAMSE